MKTPTQPNNAQKLAMFEATVSAYDRLLSGLNQNDRIITMLVVRNIAESPVISDEACLAIGRILVECHAAALAIKNGETATTA